MKKITLPFAAKKSSNHYTIALLKPSDIAAWKKTQPKDTLALMKSIGFQGNVGQTFIDGNTVTIGVDKTVKRYDVAQGLQTVKDFFTAETLSTATFAFKGDSLSKDDMTHAAIGWGYFWYRFDAYKKIEAAPKLVMPKQADKTRVEAILTSVYTLKTLINMPANDCTPDLLEKTARGMAKDFQGTLSVTKDANLEKEFPLVHMVGKASANKPRLLDLQWGNSKHPALTIVGKGVTFDTGGLNIKPGSYMALMRKDMGGSAHALALGRLVMALGLKVRLRVIVPAVENAISSNAFRPSDIMKSRKGLTVENLDTDAEGRLILADALAYACEGSPELLIDFATLTGSARAALGPDIPAAFATKDKTGQALQDMAFENDDPVWRMPFWDGYKKHLKSDSADIANHASIPGDLMYSALFLKHFVDDKTDWVHLDCMAWELSGRPGRPKGAADTGLLAALALVESRFN